MNTYRIKYKPGHKGVRVVKAVEMSHQGDCYVFVSETETVAVVSKESVVSVNLVEDSDQRPS